MHSSNVTAKVTHLDDNFDLSKHIAKNYHVLKDNTPTDDLLCAWFAYCNKYSNSHIIIGYLLKA